MDPILSRPVHVAGENKRFGDLTHAEVDSRARELKQATGWGPTMRVAPVARAWADLARAMERARAGTVADLDAATVQALARPLWITPDLGAG
jgi:hypothetical protein